MLSDAFSRDFRPPRFHAKLLCVTLGAFGFTAHAANADDPGQTIQPHITPYADPASLDPDVPAPDVTIGYAVGDDAVRYEPLLRYLSALADASPLVTLTPYAESHEGRTLFYLTITSRQNHDRMTEIKNTQSKLADPRTLTDTDDVERILRDQPGVAWMAYAIHGDELSSTDAAMQLAYQLAAGTDEATRRMRDELVINIDPTMNPDGRERYLAQLQHLRGAVPNTDYQSMQHNGLWSAGRGNHYLFDLNRDWLMQVHPETRGRAAAIQEWNPLLLVDSHEMGGLDTYLFDPPREPYSEHLSENNMKWRRTFSAQQAKAFDRFGWSYYTGEWYEEWYPGYTNSWANLLGTVGLLYEQARVNGAALTQISGGLLTYHQAVHHQLVSSLANLETLRVNRRDLMRDFLNDRQWAVFQKGPHDETFLLPPPADPARWDRFIDLLRRQGIEFGFARDAFDAAGVVNVWRERFDSREFPAGTLVARSAQPHRRLLHAILGFDPVMSERSLTDEREEVERGRETRIYDVTAWNLPMAYGLDACWAESVKHMSLSDAKSANPLTLPPTGDPPPYGWLIDGASSDALITAARLLQYDCKPRVADTAFTAEDHQHGPGTLLLRRHENPESVRQRLADATSGLDVSVRAATTALAQEGPDLGGPRFTLLRAPKVAIASQWPVASTSFGAVWHLLDRRVGIQTSPINIQQLGSIDLRQYNVLILPDAWGVDRLGAVLSDDVVEEIRAWVQAGGTLIAMGGSAAFLADSERELSQVRLKRDVLDDLDEYAEAVARERGSRHVTVDLDQVWNNAPFDDSDRTDKSPTEGASESNTTPKSAEPATPSPDENDDDDALKRDDEWMRVFRPEGTIVAADLDLDQWLCFGLGDRLPVLLSGGYALMSKHPIMTAARLAPAERLRLSGLMWPEARRRWADTAYATVERVGDGQVILFVTEPFFRGYFEGTGRMLLNAVILGPGMGTSQPIPW